MDLMVGADPEFFVQKDGVFISGHTFPCGTKEEPTKTKHGAIQNDGLALEFNVPPATTREEFVNNIRLSLGDLEEVVRAKEPTAFLVAQPTADFAEEYFKSLPKEIKVLGCNPDYDAYTGGTNAPPNPNLPFRTGSGHVHLGWTSGVEGTDRDHFIKCCKLARQLDYFLGLPSLKWDRDTRRRKMYGNAGCFRPKPYGMEYRTLSNAWLSDPFLMGVVFDQTKAAFDFFEDGVVLDEEWDGFAKAAINAGAANWEEKAPELAQILL